jgi:hypothetical protein
MNGVCDITRPQISVNQSAQSGLSSGQSARLFYKRLELSWLVFQCFMCVGSGDSCLEYVVFIDLEKSYKINTKSHWDFLFQKVFNGEMEVNTIGSSVTFFRKRPRLDPTISRASTPNYSSVLIWCSFVHLLCSIYLLFIDVSININVSLYPFNLNFFCLNIINHYLRWKGSNSDRLGTNHAINIHLIYSINDNFSYSYFLGTN